MCLGALGETMHVKREGSLLMVVVRIRVMYLSIGTPHNPFHWQVLGRGACGFIMVMVAMHTPFRPHECSVCICVYAVQPHS